MASPACWRTPREPSRWLSPAEAVGQTRRLARSCTKSTTARFWRGSNQSSKAVDCREAALHDLGLETAGARLWLFSQAIPLSNTPRQKQGSADARTPRDHAVTASVGSTRGELTQRSPQHGCPHPGVDMGFRER